MCFLDPLSCARGTDPRTVAPWERKSHSAGLHLGDNDDGIEGQGAILCEARVWNSSARDGVTREKLELKSRGPGLLLTLTFTHSPTVRPQEGHCPSLNLSFLECTGGEDVYLLALGNPPHRRPGPRVGAQSWLSVPTSSPGSEPRTNFCLTKWLLQAPR